MVLPGSTGSIPTTGIILKTGMCPLIRATQSSSLIGVSTLKGMGVCPHYAGAAKCGMCYYRVYAENGFDTY